MFIGMDSGRPADNDKYQLTNDKRKMHFLPDFVIY